MLNHYTVQFLTAQFIDPAAAGPIVDLSETITPLIDFQVTGDRSRRPDRRGVADRSPRHHPHQVDKVFTRLVGDGDGMLFHVHHHHDEKPALHNAEAVGASFGAVLPALAENGVNVVGAGRSTGPRLLLRAGDRQLRALVEGLRPIIPSGTATIQPVGDMGATVAKRIAEES